MTWTEAFRKGQDRFVIWIGIGSVLACGFLIKGATRSEFLWVVVIGAANGAAVGFGVGPAAEKGSRMLSGLLAGTPFYFIGLSILVLGVLKGRELHRNLLSDDIAMVSIFLVTGIAISFAQGLRVRNRTGRRNISA
jgi:hypothetical protein